jgi:hypothetical protein
MNVSFDEFYHIVTQRGFFKRRWFRKNLMFNYFLSELTIYSEGLFDELGVCFL